MQKKKGSLLTLMVGGLFSHLHQIARHWGWLITALIGVVASIVLWDAWGTVFAYFCLSMSLWSFDRHSKYYKVYKQCDTFNGSDKESHYKGLAEYYGLAVFMFACLALSALAGSFLLNEYFSIILPVSCFLFSLFYAWTVLPPETPRDSLMLRLKKWIAHQDESWNSTTGD